MNRGAESAAWCSNLPVTRAAPTAVAAKMPSISNDLNSGVIIYMLNYYQISPGTVGSITTPSLKIEKPNPPAFEFFHFLKSSFW